MRTLASLHHYLATSDDGGVQIHQYASGRIGDLEVVAPTTRGTAGSRSRSPPPARRRGRWTCAYRRGRRARAWPSTTTSSSRPPPGYARVERAWRAGDRVTLELPLEPRLTAPHPRVDAVRGCLAIERGPLVYCVEEADAPAGAIVDDLRIDPAAELRAVPSPDLLGGIVAVEAAGAHEPPPEITPLEGAVSLRAIPYSHWGNRGEGAMRVWIPTAG